MSSFVVRHLLESTLFCLLLSLLAGTLRTSATARHAIWLMAVAKFAVPSVLLAKTGAQIAFFWPAATWLSAWANQVASALMAIFGFMPPRSWQAGFIVWTIGTLAILALWMARLRRRNQPLAAPGQGELAALASARALLPVHLPIRLGLSNSGSEPALRGIWRPTISIPAGLEDALRARI